MKIMKHAEVSQFLQYLIILLLLLIPTTISAQERVIDQKYGFSFQPPVGFMERNIPTQSNEEHLYTFVSGETLENQPAIYLLIHKVEFNDKPSPAKKFSVKWQDQELEALEMNIREGEMDIVIDRVFLPFKEVNLQIRMMSPQARKSELDQLFPQFLSSLREEKDKAAPAIAESSKDRKFLILIILGVFLAGGALLFWLSKKAAKESVLFVLIGILSASFC